MSQRKGFYISDLNHDFVTEILKSVEATAILDSWTVHNLDNSGGVSSHIESNKKEEEALYGFILLHLQYHKADGDAPTEKKIVLKSKIPGGYIVDGLLQQIGSLLSEEEVENLKKQVYFYGMHNTHLREVQMAALKDDMLNAVMPDIYWHKFDNKQDVYIYAMEYLNEDEFNMIFKIPDTNIWVSDQMMNVLKGLAILHSRYYGKTDRIPENLRNYVYIINKEYLMPSVAHASYLIEANVSSKKHYISNNALKMLRAAYEHMSHIGEKIDSVPKTLLHNDMSTRNICLRTNPRKGKEKVCFYDFEFVAIGPVQHDLAELLPSFYFKTTPTVDEYLELIKCYISYLKQYLKEGEFDPNAFQIDNFLEVFDACLVELMLNKFGSMIGTYYRCTECYPAAEWYSAAEHYILNVLDKHSFLKEIIQM